MAGSWDVYRAAMTMLEAASPGNLERCGEGIRKLTVLYPNYWNFPAVADRDMRFEHMERMLEELELTTVGLNVNRPWNYMVEQCAYGSTKLLGHEWWTDHLISALNSPESTQPVLAKLARKPASFHRFPANTDGGE
jgi:hypothetical protein